MAQDAFPGIPYRPPDYGTVSTFRAGQLAGKPSGPGSGAVADVPAPFRRRVAAFVLDLIAADLLAGLLGTVAAAARGLAEHGFHPGLWADAEQKAMLFAGQAYPLFLFCYLAFFTAYGGRTPGKMVLKLQVVGLDGGPVSGTRALARTVCYLASVLTWGLGFLLAAGPAKRALHDRLAGTRVVRAVPERRHAPRA
jgi:uncharacterized RDD family membrane protein YckC